MRTTAVLAKTSFSFLGILIKKIERWLTSIKLKNNINSFKMVYLPTSRPLLADYSASLLFGSIFFMQILRRCYCWRSSYRICSEWSPKSSCLFVINCTDMISCWRCCFQIIFFPFQLICFVWIERKIPKWLPVFFLRKLQLHNGDSTC